jgi:type VI secretion system VgrG family protein
MRTQFAFNLINHPELALSVISFTGEAALNSLYRFRVKCLAETAELNYLSDADFFQSAALFTARDASMALGGEEEPYPTARAGIWRGLLTGVEIGLQAGKYTIVELTLEPTLSRLTDRLQNRVYLDSRAPEAMRDALLFGGLREGQFEFKLNMAAYPVREFAFQREEDLLSFIARNAEREGVAFFFDQSQGFDRAVFADSAALFPSILLDGKEAELEVAGVSGLGRGDALYDFREEKRVPPARIRLRDYNWEDPNRPLEALIDVSEYGRGEIYLYGENFETEAEGQRLGNIRKEEALCAAESYRGSSSLPGLFPGGVIGLKSCPLERHNARYLVVGASYAGSRAGAVGASLGLSLDGGDRDLRVDLTLKKLERPYRPPRLTARPQIAGSLTAWIDGAGGGQDPELDRHGRYKVLLPLDVSGRRDGKASAWIRMAQPYVGKGYGMNFPLTPGVEVLLTFVDGNPDRPVIAGAVPNAETGNLIHSGKNAYSALGTRGGSGLIFGEVGGKQQVALTSGSGRGAISVSAGSPTNTTLWSDSVNSLSSFNHAIATLSSSQAAGLEHSINVKDKVPIYLNAMITTTRSIAGVGADIMAAAYVGDEEGQESADCVYDWINAIQSGFGDLNQILNLFMMSIGTGLEKKRMRLKKPHYNLFKMECDKDGANSVWRSKMTGAHAKNLLLATMAAYGAGILRNAAGMTKDIREGWEGEGDQDGSTADGKNGKEAAAGGDGPDNADSGASAKKEPSDKAKRAKKAAYGASIASDCVSVAAGLVNAILVCIMAYRGSMAPKGVLIDNQDSYVIAKAKSYAALSGQKAVVIESSEHSWAELLRDGTYENSLPGYLGAKEVKSAATSSTIVNEYQSSSSTSSSSSPSSEAPDLESVTAPPTGTKGPTKIFVTVPQEETFQTSQCVMIRSKLARVLAEEVSLNALESILAKSQKRIQLVVGPGKKRDPVTNAVDVNDCVKTLKALTEEYPKIDGVEGDKQGVLVASLGPNAPVTIKTKSDDSPIVLTQGTDANANARSMELRKNETVLKWADKAFLRFSEDNKTAQAILQINDDVKLELKASDATLAFRSNCSVTLNDKGITFKSPKASIEAGSAKVTADFDAFRFDAATISFKNVKLAEF